MQISVASVYFSCLPGSLPPVLDSEQKTHVTVQKHALFLDSWKNG